MTPWGAASPAAGTGERVVLAGRYEVLGLIGSGGMGSVYRAFDRDLGEIVALKTLREGLATTPRLLERFRREVKLARKVTHPNVARTFDIGGAENERFMTMEYIDGEPLSALLARERRLPPARAAAIAAEICTGLDAAHSVGVLHRDLKPENVLLEKSGRIVLTDFGIACALQEPGGPAQTLGGVVGTPAYMAPEQVDGSKDLDARADIYALGVMLYEMLTGLMPWRGDSAYTLAAARLSAPPPDPKAALPSLPTPIANVVLRCMARDRDERYPSAAAVAADLAAHSPTLADGLSVPSRSAAWHPPEPGAETQSGEKTLAVLPFSNPGSEDDQLLADGLSEDLVDTLSMIRGLKVRPRASVLARRGESGDPRELGRLLSVQVVVDGTIRRMAERVRVTARLISVDDGFQLWAKRFDCSPAEVLVVSDEAAHAIAEALNVESAAAVRQAPTDAGAVELYLKGRRELNGIWHEPTRRAVELLSQAHQRAPSDATLLAAYARARARLWYYEGGAEEGRAVRALAEQALERAPERGESWFSLATVNLVEQDLAATARHLREALDRAPHLAEAHDLLAEVMLEVGSLDEALSRFRTALALDPELSSSYLMARAHAYLGRWTDVEPLLDATGASQHARVLQAAARIRLALWSDDPRGRIGALQAPEEAEAELPVLYVRLGLEAIRTGRLSSSARQAMQSQFLRAQQAPRFVVLKHQLACELNAAVGETEAAMFHLRGAADAGLADRNWLERCPLLSRLAQGPELSHVRSQVGSRADQALAALKTG